MDYHVITTDGVTSKIIMMSNDLEACKQIADSTVKNGTAPCCEVYHKSGKLEHEGS